MDMKKETFSQKLAKQLQAAGFEVHEDQFKDKSARWVELRKDGYSLEINFDIKGQKIIGLSLHKEIVQVVDSKRLF